MTRVGAVDCGTNSIRLLIADVNGDGRLTDVLRRMEVVRLGYGVDRTGMIDPEAMRRTVAMAAEYAGQCREAGAEAVRFVATSASRDAGNAEDFVAGVREAFAHFGTAPEVISGAEEAELSFRGATGELHGRGVGPLPRRRHRRGSTEFVRGTTAVEASRSVDIGCVRMTERHLRSDPPTPSEVEAAARDIDAAIDVAASAVDFTDTAALVGLAGSVTTITAHALGLPVYDAQRIHLTEMTPEDTLRACVTPAHDPGGARRAAVHAPRPR